jgi:hypothetical protein
MANTSHALMPRDLGFTAPAAESKTSDTTVSFLGRVYAAMMLARTRQAEVEITRYLSGTGGKFTDEAEREIERRFLSNQSHW